MSDSPRFISEILSANGGVGGALVALHTYVFTYEDWL